MKLAISAVISALAAPVALAQPYDVSWFTIDGGGGTSTVGVFTISGTIGQHDAGVTSGGGFTFSGGFWVGGGSTPGGCDSIDFNNDGLFPDTQDIDAFLSVFSGGSC